MTDTTLPPEGPGHDRIEPVDIQQEMQSSYIDYAMSVIVGRALPTCVTVSNRCTVACSMRCSTTASAPTAGT